MGLVQMKYLFESASKTSSDTDIYLGAQPKI